MKQLYFTVIVAVFVWTHLADGKATRTQQSLKKATAHLKPTKSPKSVLEAFKSLPADDLEFIKQLDKQFKNFGDNVKIKIQKENRTTSKNIKRTIDGSLGYAYQNPNDQQSMYSFSKPKYEVYPYSQHDIPPSAEYNQNQHYLHYLRNYPTALVDSDPDYYRKQAQHTRTSVEIQPSHSYEIKQTEHGYKTIYNGHDEHGAGYGHHEEPSHEPVPVIVLRVPGPAKYAAHLQTLLQQYLEARAAEYIQSLQEQEAHGVDSSQQIASDHNLNGFGDLPVLPYSQQLGAQHAFVPSQMFIQPIQPYFAQQLVNPYANAHIAQPVDAGHDHIVATPAPATYYSAHSHDTSDDSGAVHPTAYDYHNIHEEQQHHDTHSTEEIVYGQPHHETVSEHNAHLTNENFPSDKHTQVYFKTTTEAPYHSDEHQYGHEPQPQPQPYLPHTQVNTYRAPLVYHKLEEEFYNTHDDHGDIGQYASNGGYDDNAQPIGSSTPYPHTVAITQRPAVLPHNYHAQVSQLQHYGDDAAYNHGDDHLNHGYDDEQSYNTNGYDYSTEASDDHLYKRNSNKKRQSAQNRDDQMKKFKKIANRMRSRMAANRQTSTTPVQT